jgi:uracil permease
MSILISIVSGVILSAILGLLSTEAIVAANMISVPKFSLPLFNVGSILIIAPVALVTFMEHIGDITTNGTVVGKDFISDPGLNRTLMGDGLATAFAGLVGGAPNTTYGENTATLELTKNFNPKNLRLAAIFAIVLSFIGKFSAIVSSIPTCVMGGISLVLFTSISIVGVKTIKREKVKLTLKNLLIMVPIFVIGLSGILGLNIAIPVTATVSFSGLSLAAIAGIILNLVFKFVKVSFLEKSLINK